MTETEDQIIEGAKRIAAIFGPPNRKALKAVVAEWQATKPIADVRADLGLPIDGEFPTLPARASGGCGGAW